MSVVDWHDSPYDVYIGRYMPPEAADFASPSGTRAETCIYGNPFILNDVNDQEERKKVISQYREHLLKPEQEWLVTKARQELPGKVLGCWCKPKDCHGDVLLSVVNATDEQLEAMRKDLGLA